MAKRTLAVQVVLLLCIMLPIASRVSAHAGHDEAPAAPSQASAVASPRFYSRSDSLEAVLVFPEHASKSQDPTLYLMRLDDSHAVVDAQVVTEILTPEARKLETTTASIAGTYKILGLDASKTTHTLSIEVSAGEISDFLTFDNVTLAGTEAKSDQEGHGHGDNTAGLILGLPRYIFWALVAVAGVLAVANLLVVSIWLVRLARGRARPQSTDFNKKAGMSSESLASDTSAAEKPAHGKGRDVALFFMLIVGAVGRLQAHAGEDHSGASLAASAVQSPGSAHFVPIDTQFQADIHTTRVLERNLPLSFRALGQVQIRPDLTADVTPPAEGKLKPPVEGGRLPIAGAYVQKGDILVILEQLIPAAEKITLTNDRAQVEADLGQAQQELTLATQNAQRTERLASVIAAKEVDQARAQLKIAQDKIAGLRKRLATLTSSLSTEGIATSVKDIQIRAPLSGIVAESHATVGEYVASDKKLFQIINLDEVFVQADIFESDIAAVREAKSARITVEAFPERSFQGTLHTFGQQIDPQSQTLRAVFNVPNPDQLLRGGMFSKIEIESGEEKPLLLIPKTALFTQNGVRQAFLKTAPEIYVATPLNVSGFREEWAVVASGLKKDDRVAVSGLYQIRMSPAMPAAGAK
ncbi:MAG: efflux RND transporter periplasmic adaptor subunit [Candidatus Sumerlaeaceae bacterium]